MSGGGTGLSGAVRISAGIPSAGHWPHHDPGGRCPAERTYLFPVLRRDRGPAGGGTGPDPQPLRVPGGAEAAGGGAGRRHVPGPVLQQHRPGHASLRHRVSGGPRLGSPGRHRPGDPGAGASVLPGVQCGQPGAAAQKAPPGEPRRPGYAVPSPAGRSPDLCAAVGAAGRLPLPGAGAGRRVRGRPVLPAVGYRYPL